MVAALAAAALALSAPLHAQEFSAEMGIAHDLVLRAQAGRPWLVSHQHGILQQINDAMAHLTAESKPSVAVVRGAQGSGTGFLIDSSGLMITCTHVVIESGLNSKVKVRFPDGNEYTGVVVAVGSMSTEIDAYGGRDLAIIQLPPRQGGWLALPLGDLAKLREGDMVVLMGYPQSLPFSVSQGIVSGLDDRKGGVKGFPVKFVQSDAAMNPGNSGGPMLAMDGTVVGVNTFILSPGGGSDGLGFSIGVDAVKSFLAEYRKRGPFSDQAPKKGHGKTPQPNHASCPTTESLSKPWVEHAGAAPRALLNAHLVAALDGAFPGLLPVNTVSWWIGASRRGRGDSESAPSPGCLVRGSVALYILGHEKTADVDFVEIVNSGAEAGLNTSLVEFRWYDEKDGRKHRWFNIALATKLGWTTDGRGAPSDTRRPISLPDAANELL